jgi:hypothetical protein
MSCTRPNGARLVRAGGRAGGRWRSTPSVVSELLRGEPSLISHQRNSFIRSWHTPYGQTAYLRGICACGGPGEVPPRVRPLLLVLLRLGRQRHAIPASPRSPWRLGRPKAARRERLPVVRHVLPGQRCRAWLPRRAAHGSRRRRHGGVVGGLLVVKHAALLHRGWDGLRQVLQGVHAGRRGRRKRLLACVVACACMHQRPKGTQEQQAGRPTKCGPQRASNHPLLASSSCASTCPNLGRWSSWLGVLRATLPPQRAYWQGQAAVPPPPKYPIQSPGPGLAWP